MWKHFKSMGLCQKKLHLEDSDLPLDKSNDHFFSPFPETNDPQLKQQTIQELMSIPLPLEKKISSPTSHLRKLRR